MRLVPLILDLQDRFTLLSNHDLAYTIAEAIHHADIHGVGTFKAGDETYKIGATFEHGCINYNCNPATCWMEYEVVPWKT